MLTTLLTHTSGSYSRVVSFYVFILYYMILHYIILHYIILCYIIYNNLNGIFSSNLLHVNDTSVPKLDIAQHSLGRHSGIGSHNINSSIE